MKNLLTLMFLVPLLAHAQVFKCKDAQGKAVYSDQPCANAQPLRIDQAPEVITRPGDDPNARALRILQSDARAKDPPQECKFSYYRYGDGKGKILADNAKAECLRNIDLREAGRGNEVSMESYNLWRDHHQIQSADRNAAAGRAATQNAARTVANAIDHPRVGPKLRCEPNLLGGMDCR